MYNYLVTNKTSGKKEVVEASTPANAIAKACEDEFDVQRLDGAALEIVKSALEKETENKGEE